MKFKTLHMVWLIIAAVATTACNDTIDKLGYTIQPGNDRVTVGADTLQVTARTVQVDSVFSKTKYPILGEYTDPVFGSIRSDYVGEFYYPETMEFKEQAKIDSVRLTISYTSILGDSLAPMSVGVYRVKEKLPGNTSYTNFNPQSHADMSAPLGTKVFTGRNNTYRTETYYTGTTTQTVRVYEINTTLPKSIGQSFLDEYKKEGHGALKNTETFRKFFPGLYITTEFGNSTVLNVNLTSLKVFYNYLDRKGSSQKTDTIRSTEWRLNITPEVTQINHIENDNAPIFGSGKAVTYVKSPAGVNSELHFPISRIAETLSKSALNQARFVVHALTEGNEELTVKLSPPDQLLMVHKDSLKQFFEKRRLPDNVTSYMATFNRDNFTYNFGNIAPMVNHYNKAHKADAQKPLDQTFVLVPVDVTFTTQGGNMYQPGTQVATAVYNQMKPSAVMLDNRDGKMRLEIIYSAF